MKHLVLLMFALAYTVLSFSQADTLYFYTDKGGNDCNKDTAHYITKIFKQDKLWVKQRFWAKQKNLQYEEFAMDKAFKKNHGTTTRYHEDGHKESVSNFQKGKWQDKTFYYANGSKRSYMDNKTQTGWDSTGNVIDGYIVEREARFAGSWVNYLETNLNPHVAADAGAPAGVYKVKIQFIIDKEGNVTNPKVLELPNQCLPCGVEAVKVLTQSPKWIPAVQNNKPVIYQAVQFISFQVIEEEPRKRMF